MTCEHEEDLQDIIEEARDICRDEDAHDRIWAFLEWVAEYKEPL